MLILSTFFTSPAYAVIFLPFGGLVTFTISCTCGANLWVYFTPLSPSPPLPTSGALVYSPYGTRAYSYFFVGKSGTWELGDYIPGVQTCWIYAGKSCAILPSFGQMKKVGTGM